MDKKVFTISLVIIFILGLGIGYFFGVFKTAPVSEKEPKSETFEPQKIKSVYGEIVELGDNNFKVKIAPLPIPDFQEKFPERIVKIIAGTKIIKQVSKSQEELRKEIDALAEKGIRNQPVPSSTEKEVIFNELKAGDNVFIEAAEEIRDKEEFEAEKVVVLFISQPSGQAPVSQ
ncbi:MAG: hypothetical protein A3I88_00795 [Candidatus Portnoybacteria bacterium RIFCSPLOWO2_12_FULL_39_9]|uniref:Uncharacterized protein n=1 Tax=Candidatus Portnoybacteria bacterium RIFCSPHIGHO2_12_FULL_38_9 TaxID=1801997 RepID=A0A1G2FE15_9BACT|nr:MAG: hypothetical protein A3H00_02315 [Candidatus Portnoybacteria bacterium RBG_13_40_8]OGZ35646.1 MAG: hypothetical protein A2646_01215 [Candidatus Portnoybacteria bacterium RIFCSPHIGHO2_02_FULL_39_12]OGZ36299.1 MAG: hypothetical protein A3J64_03045 [Candidatus Portnoybacteria bacterium RIFCSPHIGHO2_12_FULL_38_9]OGZ37847.1 MAG: hypothetical protein A3F21_00655 [Candidatus Portnoybacteria bacterium RIFCSPLOWO2_01_FULL_38_39]OGZ40763.1 MAG: hypothetical protein A3I88_00795 [Candidatus Portnoy